MKQLFSRFAVLSLSILAFTSAASAQNYPWPRATLSACGANCAGVYPYQDSTGAWKTVPMSSLNMFPYSAPLTRHAGRFVDSQNTRDFQAGYGMRTLRARGAVVAPERNRVYMMLGSTFASYDMNDFFNNRLGQPMQTNPIVVSREGNPPEKWLRPNAWVYPEAQGSGWQILTYDTQDFLYGFDYDDRGYVYLAYSQFGWGIVRDNSDATLTLVSQVFQTPGVAPGKIVAFKAGGRYYALVVDKGSPSTAALFDVTNPASPSQVRTLIAGTGGFFGAFELTRVLNGSDHDLVIISAAGTAYVYRGAAIVSGAGPAQTFPPSASRKWRSVTSDGTNFFAVEYNGGSPVPIRFSVFARSGSTYTPTPYGTSDNFIVGAIEYGAGYLSISGLGNADGRNVPDVRVFRLSGLAPSEISMGSFFRYYYNGQPPNQAGQGGLSKPATFVGDVYGAVMANSGGRDYIIWSGRAVGDVYEVNGPGTPVNPNPTPTPTATPNPTPTRSPTPTPTPGGPTPTPDPGGSACGQPQILDVNYSCPLGNCAPGVQLQFAAKDFANNSRFNGNCSDSFNWNFGDGASSSEATPRHAFPGNGPYSVRVTVTPSGGFAVTATRTVSFGGGGPTPTPTPTPGGPTPTPTPTPDPVDSCSAPPSNTAVVVGYRGRTSDCTTNSISGCAANETIDFLIQKYASNYNFGSCHNVEWDLGGGVKKTGTSVTHTYASIGNYPASVKVTVAGQSNTFPLTVRVGSGGNPVTPITSADFTSSATTVNVGQSVTFTGTTLPDESGVVWTWNFGDGSPNGNGKVVTHAFAATGAYVVTLQATRGSSVAPPVSKTVNVANPNQFAFLLPVVAHQPGQSGTQWRTDVQIFTPDPNFNPASPLLLEVDFKGTKKTLTVDASTLIRTDFMSFFTSADEAGPMIIRGNHPFVPQIWTRTYNVAQSGEGTYGQFVPAVRLQSATGSLGVGGAQSFLAGLENTADVRTNLGIINPTGTAFDVQVIAFPENSGVPLGLFTVTVPPYQLQQINDLRTRIPALPLDRKYSLRVTNIAGTQMIAYHSAIDQNSNDPVYIQGLSVAEAQPEANQVQWVAGVAHLAVDNWKTDLTIFNPDELGVQFDLTYYDATGAPLAPKSYTLEAKHFIYLRDVLVSAFLLDSSATSLGSIRIETKSVGVTAYPMVYARTYSDQGPLGTYGQGIPAFAGSRANVGISKDAYIAGVRSTTSFVTNLGLLSVSTESSVIEVTLLDRISGRPSGSWTYNLAPNQSVIHPNVIRAMHPTADQGSLRIRVISGGPVWAYASIKDTLTKDPEYVPAVGTP